MYTSRAGFTERAIAQNARAIRQPGSHTQFRKLDGEGRGRIMRVEATRIRKNPGARVSDGRGLRAHNGISDPEGRAIAGDAQQSEPLGSQGFHPSGQVPSSLQVLLPREFCRPGCRPPNDAGDTDAKSHEVSLLLCAKQMRRETGTIQRRPQPVSWCREIVSADDRSQSGIDADENDGQTVGHDIFEMRIIHGFDDWYSLFSARLPQIVTTKSLRFL